MKASLTAMAVSAYNRAQSTRSICLAVAIWRTIGLKVRGPVNNQKRPIVVCSALRLLLLRLPSSRISLRSFVQTSEVSAGGAAGRNCEAAFITHGVIFPAVDSIGTAVAT